MLEIFGYLKMGIMKKKKFKYLHVGQYVAKVEVAVMEDSTGFTVEDADKLDEIREALGKGDLKSAAKYCQIYELRPVAHQ